MTTYIHVIICNGYMKLFHLNLTFHSPFTKVYNKPKTKENGL